MGIGKYVSVECVRNAERIIHTSYSHSETFNSAVFSRNCGISNLTICRPRMTDTSKVVGAVIRSEGCIFNVRDINKNLNNFAAKVFKGNLV